MRIPGTVTAGLALLFFCGSVHAQSYLTDGLAAFYPFNGNVNDESGNGNHGTAVNTSLSADRFGTSGHAITFSPSLRSTLNVSSSSIPSGVAPMTVALWMRLLNPTIPANGASKFTVFGAGQNSVIRWNFNLIFQGNAVDFSPNVESLDESGYRGNYGKWSLFPDFPTALEWHHLALSFRSATEIAMFLDGKSVPWETPPNAKTSFRCDGPFYIGSSSIGESFSGQIDDVRIYNRALADQELKALYDYESQPSRPSPPPLLNAFSLSRLAYGSIQGLRIPLSPPDRAAFRIEASFDLRSWAPLITFPTNSGPFEFVDSSANLFTNRFYRAVRP